ncbi:acyl-CoA dehydrogenase/oxidase [Cladochytrium replicatum]|nr:acyl-CoA dehydrogenase/oxidase [Cladochytrium replicatum]
MPSFTAQQVAAHNTEKDCWIIVHGKVYDVTKFLADHPGGKKVLIKVAGTDASKQFDQFHSAAILQQWGPKLLVGDIGSAAPKTTEPVGYREEDVVFEGMEEGDTFGDGVPYGDPYWYSDWQSPYYKESHRRLRAVVRSFVAKEIMPYCYEWDEAKQIPKSLFKKAADAGILGGIVGSPWSKYAHRGPAAGIKPEEFDGFHEFIICDELSRCGSGGVLWGLIGGLGIGLPAILHFGSEELKQRIAPGCLDGTKNICLAVTEPYAGSDVANLKCEAKKTADGKHYILNGEKKWITNGVFADYFTVACRTGGEGMNGISLLVVSRDMPGVSTRHMPCMGVWASGTSYVTFEDVKVPVENLIGKENKGFRLIMYNFNHERMGIAIQATRFARVCYEEALKYSHKRRTFGKKLVDHPVIRQKLAHMARQIEATHAWMETLIYQATRMPAEMQMLKLGGPIALLKAQSTQTFEYCAREAAQIFGGLSYSRGGQGEKVERLYREVRAYAIPGGSEEIMLDLGIRQSIKVAQFMGAKL